jgi:hypothetical protein
LPGTLDFVSRPDGAEVYVDGAETGLRTPASLGHLPADRTTRIELRKPGYRNWSGTGALNPGEHKQIEATLAAAQGGLRIQTVPWTNVYLDGNPIGRTPLETRKVPAGKHELTLVNAEAGIEDRHTVEIPEDGMLKQSYTYMGELRVAAPDDSEFCIDDRCYDRPPTGPMRLPVGSHTVILRNPQAGSERRFQVQVKSDRVTTVDAGDSPPPREPAVP